jgi:hypothetical protein
MSAALGSRRRSLSLFRSSMNSNKTGTEQLGTLAEATQAEEENEDDLTSSEDESTLAGMDRNCKNMISAMESSKQANSTCRCKLATAST